MFSLKYFKSFSKCNPCLAAAIKMFPQRHLLYILFFKKLFMELIVTVFISEKTYGPSYCFVILPTKK